MNIIYENDTGSLGIVDYLKIKSNDISSDIQCVASSTLPYQSVSNNYAIDVIFDDDDNRWISQDIENQNFEITFQRRSAYIYGYSMKWSAGRRYNENWIVEGWNNKWFLLDTQKSQTFCSSQTLDQDAVACSHQILFRKVADNPSIVSKLRFTATAVDSNNNNYFSLSHLKLYGFWGASIETPHQSFIRLKMILSISILLFGHLFS